MQKYNNKGTEILKTSRAEQPLTKLMPLERKPEKNLWGKHVQEIMIGTMAFAPSN